MVGGSITVPALYELAVLGGTGLYDNARGSMVATRIRTARRGASSCCSASSARVGP